MPQFKNPAFIRFFGLLLTAELVTILAAWFLLNFSVRLWIDHKVSELTQISESARTAVDWSHLDEIQKGRPPSSVYQTYVSKIQKLNKQYFPHNDGDISAIKVLKEKEYLIAAEDSFPYEKLGNASQFELDAWKGKAAFSPVPYADTIGTHLTACSPVFKNGQVLALIVADFDSTSLQNFQSVVRTSFWWSLVPAVLISLILASALATKFVEPMEFLREIQEVKLHPEQVAPSIKKAPGGEVLLSKRENEIAILVGQGLKNREIAENLSISEETVKQHLKNIFQKLGISSRVNLALFALSKADLASEAYPPKG